MATINIARYYNIEHFHGNIATGSVANINFLTDENESNTGFCSCKRKMGETRWSSDGNEFSNLIGVNLVLNQSIWIGN